MALGSSLIPGILPLPFVDRERAPGPGGPSPAGEGAGCPPGRGLHAWGAARGGRGPPLGGGEAGRRREEGSRAEASRAAGILARRTLGEAACLFTRPFGSSSSSGCHLRSDRGLPLVGSDLSRIGPDKLGSRHILKCVNINLFRAKIFFFKVSFPTHLLTVRTSPSGLPWNS